MAGAAHLGRARPATCCRPARPSCWTVWSPSTSLRPLFTTRVRAPDPPARDRRPRRSAEPGRGRARPRRDRGRRQLAADRRDRAASCSTARPTALYDLALELDALSPLQLETRSKSVRGYALARASRRPCTRPRRWRSAAAPRVDEAIGAILRACLQHWCANEAAALDGRDPEGVHQMRVALRRLRSAVSVFGRLIAPERAGLARRRGQADHRRTRRRARLGRVPDRSRWPR